MSNSCPTLAVRWASFEKNCIMKKVSITVFLLLYLFVASFGQKIQIGLHHGIGLSQLSNHHSSKNDPFGTKRVFSWVSGLDFQVNLNHRLAISTGYNFTRKGTIRYHFSEEYNYREVPVSVRFNARKNQEKAWQPYFRAGGYFAYLTSQHEKDLEPDLPHAEPYFIEYSNVRQTDFGFVAGVGMDHRFSKRFSVFLEGRMEHGLIDVFDVDWARKKKIFNVACWGMAGMRAAF